MEVKKGKGRKGERGREGGKEVGREAGREGVERNWNLDPAAIPGPLRSRSMRVSRS